MKLAGWSKNRIIDELGELVDRHHEWAREHSLPELKERHREIADWYSEQRKDLQRRFGG